MSDTPDLPTLMPEQPGGCEEEKSPAAFPQSRVVSVNALQDRPDTVNLPVKIRQPIKSCPSIM